MAEPFIEQQTRKVALLIDGDNAQASLLNKMLAEVAKHGSVTIRRIYGDWTTSEHALLEGRPAHARRAAHPAVPLHRRQERHRQRPDHRRHGHHAPPPGRGLLHRLLGQRLHAPGHAHPRGGLLRHGHRPEEDAQVLRQRLRPVHLHREPRPPGPGAAGPAGAAAPRARRIAAQGRREGDPGAQGRGRGRDRGPGRGPARRFRQVRSRAPAQGRLRYGRARGRLVQPGRDRLLPAPARSRLRPPDLRLQAACPSSSRAGTQALFEIQSRGDEAGGAAIYIRLREGRD
ncbi:MAG: hypothetical protein MZV49_06305 [Rhodopseudomonas palustris]|nr:hypothetical protein [Rhodopseudomonas palustris]